MNIFDIVDRFELRLKLYQLDSNVVKIWKYDECICLILKENQFLDVENCYVTHPRLKELLKDCDSFDDFPVYANSWHCHGGVTYVGNMVISESFDPLYVVGFDYAHLRDWTKLNPHGHYTPIPEKMVECESLAKQVSATIQLL